METKYVDKISDKRTIAQKYGNKDSGDKILKANPKYKDITKIVETGSTINSNKFMSDQLISKRKSELFKRLKGSTIIKLINITQAKQTESIYNVGGEGQPDTVPTENNDNKSIITTDTNKSHITNVTAVTYATEMLGNLNDIDFLLLDLREQTEYDRIHIREAQSFPAPLISRDKFTPQMITMKNKDGKMIILYHTDERNGIPYANNFFEKGYDNVYFLSGGIEDFEKRFPEYLEGPEKETYINMKKERERQAKELEEKRKGGKKSQFHLCGQLEKKNVSDLKKNLQKK